MSGRTVTVIFGPSGAGKTTLARALAESGDYIVDQESIMGAIIQGGVRFRPHDRAMSRRMFALALDLAATAPHDVYITIGGATRRERLDALGHFPAGKWTRTLYGIVPDDPEVPIARARCDSGRPSTSRSAWRDIVGTWYRTYEPPNPDEADQVMVGG